MHLVQIATSRFGVLTPTDEQRIRIDGGLLGFPDADEFVVVPVVESPEWIWLQSTSDPDLAFLSVKAFDFFPDYNPDIPEADASALGIEDPDDAEVLALVTIIRGSSGEVEDISANLLGPIVINVKTLVARQIVLAESGHSTKTRLLD